MLLPTVRWLHGSVAVAGNGIVGSVMTVYLHNDLRAVVLTLIRVHRVSDDIVRSLCRSSSRFWSWTMTKKLLSRDVLYLRCINRPS